MSECVGPSGHKIEAYYSAVPGRSWLRCVHCHQKVDLKDAAQLLNEVAALKREVETRKAFIFGLGAEKDYQRSQALVQKEAS